jgi:hypothetical protein
VDAAVAEIFDQGVNAMQTKASVAVGNYRINWGRLVLEDQQDALDLRDHDERRNGPYLHKHCTRGTSKKDKSLICRKKFIELGFVFEADEWQAVKDHRENVRVRTCSSLSFAPLTGSGRVAGGGESLPGF